MLNRTIFISDLHLSEENKFLNNLFDTFIRKTLSEKENIDAVYILGDFFNIWLGDDMAGPWEMRIMSTLTQLVNAGIPVYFMQGNRDFLLEESFIKKVGVIFLSDPAVIDLYGKKVLLKHGDDLCTEDRWYQIFRSFVRLNWVKRIYLNLPLIWRQHIASRIRQNSQNRGMRDIYAKVSVSLVEKLFQKNFAEILIHGHTHCPQIKKINVDEQERKHVILSDWNTHGNQLVVDENGEMRLDYFE